MLIALEAQCVTRHCIASPYISTVMNLRSETPVDNAAARCGVAASGMSRQSSLRNLKRVFHRTSVLMKAMIRASIFLEDLPTCMSSGAVIARVEGATGTM